MNNLLKNTTGGQRESPIEQIYYTIMTAHGNHAQVVSVNVTRFFKTEKYYYSFL